MSFNILLCVLSYSEHDILHFYLVFGIFGAHTVGTGGQLVPTLSHLTELLQGKYFAVQFQQKLGIQSNPFKQSTLFNACKHNNAYIICITLCISSA